MNTEFWDFLQALVETSKIIIDRPKGTVHHRFPGKKYPVNYGFLEGTKSIDLGGVDVWLGSLGDHKVVGILSTIDLLKRDTEIKVLIDCTKAEIETINEFINDGQMRGLCIIK